MVFSLVVLGFIFITGLVVGSFLNVVILRTVSNESIVFPGSKCPKCQNSLKWYHNIPLLSYLFLGGKCAYCKEHISLQYPLVEFLTGCIFVGLFLRFCLPFDPLFGLNYMNPISWAQVIHYLFSLIASCLFIVIAGTDFLEMRCATSHLYSLIGTGLVYSIVMAVMNIVFYTKELGAPEINLNFFLTCPVLYSICAGVVGFIFMEILRHGSKLIVQVDAFGDGDSYIAAGIGTVIGALFGNFSPYTSFLNILAIMGGIFVLSAILPVIFILPIYLKKLISNKNYYTLGALATFMIYAIAYIYAQNSGWLENIFALIICSLILLILGIFVCNEILKGIKNQTSDGYPIPFGPSLVISAFICIAFLPIS